MPAPLVSTSAVCTCSFGAAPATLNALPASRVMIQGKPAATIADTAPLLNLPTFGVCSSLSNPTVAAATTAALGVLTPMPCVPATGTPWIPGVPTLLIGGKPAINKTCTAMCAYGGVIQIQFPGSTTALG